MTFDASAAGPPVPAPATGSARGSVTGFAIALAGSAVLGLPAGLIWNVVAPRATLQEVGKGTAEMVNAETTAFITADALFCLIAVVAGLLTGVLGYRFLVSRHDQARRTLAVSGLILGALAGAAVMMWLGQEIGLSAYDHSLASSRTGALFSSQLALGAKSALAFWPLLTSAVLLIAEWGVRRDARSAGDTPAHPA
jgi:hypothetical protein